MPKSLLYLAVHDPHVPLTGTGARGGPFVDILSKRFGLDLVYMEGSGQPPLPGVAERFAGTLSVVRTKRRVPFTQGGYFLFSRGFYRAAAELLSQRSYDYILCDYGISAVYGILLSRRFGVPYIYCSHNIEFLGSLDKAKKDPRRLFLAPYVYWAEKRAVKESRILVPISRGDAEFYARWTDPAKMVMIPQGVDVQVFNPFYEPPRNNPKVVLFCGNFKIQFNVDAVRALRDKVVDRVLARRPDTEFHFIGAYPPDVRHPRMKFLGFREDYAERLKAADVVISPVLQGRGFPTKIVEALACGKPLVSTPMGVRAVEGRYESLRVCGLEDFPDPICGFLGEDRPPSIADFEEVRKRYSWQANLEPLMRRIEGTAAEPRPLPLAAGGIPNVAIQAAHTDVR